MARTIATSTDCRMCARRVSMHLIFNTDEHFAGRLQMAIRSLVRSSTFAAIQVTQELTALLQAPLNNTKVPSDKEWLRATPWAHPATDPRRPNPISRGRFP